MKKILILLLLVTGVTKAQIVIDLDKGTKKVEAIVYKKDGSTVKGTLKLLSLQLLKKKIEIKGDKNYKIKNGEIDSIQVFNEKGVLTPYPMLAQASRLCCRSRKVYFLLPPRSFRFFFVYYRY